MTIKEQWANHKRRTHKALAMRRTTSERFYDMHAKRYSKGDYFTNPSLRARTAMSFADDITWHFILRYLPQRKSALILDAGAGDGYWTERLIKRGYRNIVLYDISQGMLEEAKERLSKLKVKRQIQFIRGDIANMHQLRSNAFDYVFSQYDAVSYSMKPAKAIRELARVAKSRSHVVVSLDTKFRRVPELIEAGQINAAEALLKTDVSDEFGFSQYNLTWEKLAFHFKAAGLEVVEIVGAPVFMHQVKERSLAELEKDLKIRKRLLRIELLNCTNTSLVNFAGHLQMIGKKIR